MKLTPAFKTRLVSRHSTEMAPHPLQQLLALLDPKESRRHDLGQLLQLVSTHLLVTRHVPAADKQDVPELNLGPLPLGRGLQIPDRNRTRAERMVLVDALALGGAPRVVVQQHAPSDDALGGPGADAVHVGRVRPVDVG